MLALALAGCGGGGRIYKAARNMPAEFIAPPVENVQTIDLSKLANFSVSSELIDRGDVLEVTVTTGYAKEPAETSPIRVAEDGSAIVPIVGRVQLAGLELQGAEQVVRTAAVERGVYRDPSVTLVMKRQRTNKITVIGAVEEPGVYELPRSASGLLAALVAAKGLSKEAGVEVEIRRPALHNGTGAQPSLTPPGGGDRTAGVTTSLASFQPQSVIRPASSTKVNLITAAREGGGGYTLDDGDVVMVEKRDPQPIHVIGLVTKPGQFDLPKNQDLHLLDAIALAGGPSIVVADKVHLIRHLSNHPEPIVIEVSLKEAKRQGKGNLRLTAGDVVSVEQTPETVVVGVMANFLRFGIGATLPAF